MKTVLITGGSGTIGMRLSELLSEEGYAVRHLSRKLTGREKYDSFVWNIEEGYIDPAALIDIDHLIHLAGTGIADGRWTEDQKREILASRVDALDLLWEKISEHHVSLKSMTSASGINYYGYGSNQKIYTESDSPGVDFLSEVCIKWERAAQQFEVLCPVCRLRTAVVLSPKGGALEKLAQPIRFGFGAALGSGQQWMPWIHLDDICRMYIHSIKKALHGPFNATADEQVTNEQFTKLTAEILRKPLWLPKVPAFALKLLFGEMAEMLLHGNRCENEKIKETGFEFRYGGLKEALGDCLN